MDENNCKSPNLLCYMVFNVHKIRSSRDLDLSNNSTFHKFIYTATFVAAMLVLSIVFFFPYHLPKTKTPLFRKC